MQATSEQQSILNLARLAGALYLIIIVCGLFAELGVRSQLVVAGDAAQTAQNILASRALFGLGFVADIVMALSDVALAILLYVIFRPAGRTLALVAVALRLVQTAILGANLLNYAAAGLVLTGAGPLAAFSQAQVEGLALFFMDLHRHGYDLGLIFFGLHCAVFGWLLIRSRYVPRLIGGLIALSSISYLVGSFTLFLAPARADAIVGIYGLPLVAELALCLWLLIKRVRLPG